MSSSPAVCRLLVESHPNTGAWNMAVDEALLESAFERKMCTVRLYRWAEPTLSLGYFQPAEYARSSPHLRDLPLVRRLTGGGAILHHHEWTYSCTLPPPLVPRDPRELYARVHRQIIAVLAELGISAELRGAVCGKWESAAGQEPFLCFSRGDPRDVVIGGHKVVGSAQRRRRGSLLQHGSVLLRRSPHAPEHPGLYDLCGEAGVETLAVAQRIAAAIAAGFTPRSCPGELTADERNRAAVLAAGRYRHVDWRAAQHGPRPADNGPWTVTGGHHSV